ncbi:MAG: hypothetical protein ACRDP9_25690 [Kribbellaceae bacterium]
MVGWSLGGYYVPRAAAFEKRVTVAVAWGANHNWGQVQKRRLEREGENHATYDGIEVLCNNASALRFGALDELTVADGLHRAHAPPMSVISPPDSRTSSSVRLAAAPSRSHQRMHQTRDASRAR